MVMILLTLFALWTGFAWWAGWKSCDALKWHGVESERLVNYVAPSPLPHPAQVAREQKRTWERLKRVDQEWRA